MRQLLALCLALFATLGSAQAQSPYGFVGSANNAAYLGFVGGGGGPYTPNYGQSFFGQAPRTRIIIKAGPVIVINQVTARQLERGVRERHCEPVVLSVPTGRRFEPFSACPPGGEAPVIARRFRGPKIIRIE